MYRLLAFLLLVVSAPAALAWNAAGHRLVAAIAWRQLSPAVRDSVAELLAGHPDATHWTGDPYARFLEAATWPDDIRRDPRFYDEDDEVPTQRLPGYPDMARHKRWHYVDSAGDGHPRDGELDHQLDRLAKVLADPREPAAARRYALPWLVHLVADGHQPLHVGIHDDEGGNRVEVDDPLNPRLPSTNLHAWWDDLPGPPWLRGKRLESVADALVSRYPAPAQNDAPHWLAESRELGRTAAYPPIAADGRRVIGEDFRAQGRTLANQRLTEAGYRLGHLLEGLLGGVPRGTPSRGDRR